MEEEEGIIYLKMTGTFLAWGHYSTCARARSRVRALTRSLILLKTYSFFFFFKFPSNFKLKIFVFSFSSQALTQPQKVKSVQPQFRNSATFNYISELKASNWVDQHPLPPPPVIQIQHQVPGTSITLS